MLTYNALKGQRKRKNNDSTLSLEVPEVARWNKKRFEKKGIKDKE
jgi:hypothetical protein